MGRAGHCTDEKRKLIRTLRSDGKTYKEIAKSIGCSQNMVTNALKPRRQQETRGRRRKTTENQDRQIVRLVKKSPFMTSTDIKKELNLGVSSRTVRNRLLASKLRARAARKTPFVSKRNIKKRKHFAKTYLELYNRRGLIIFKNILWSDETKINLFGPDSKHYVRRPTNSEFDPKYTRKTIKHNGGNIMVWGSFSWYGVGPLFWIKETMTQNHYVQILQNIMLPYAEEEMPLNWKFQQDNDPKHTSRMAKRWFQENNVITLDWPAQSPDLNPIENLWHDVKSKLGTKKFKNKEDLWNGIQAAWQSTPLETCQHLVSSMPRRLQQVLKMKGYPTKY